MNSIQENLLAVASPAPTFLELFRPGEIAAIALIGAVVGWGAISLVLWYCKMNRSSVRTAEFHHAQTGEMVPRYGGIAFAAALVAAAVVLGTFRGLERMVQMDALAFFLPPLAMFGVGFWDDLKPLGARKKLALQILVALAAYFMGLQVTTFKNPFTGEIYNLELIGVLLTVLWLVGMTNLINLVDGIDGLAGGVALMLMGLLVCVGLKGPALYLVVPVCVGGALISFLRFNFPPARIYMGDGGAYFLGFLIGSMTIASSQKGTVMAALIAPVIALGLPIIDTSLAILRRGLKGLPLFRADRKHIHHRLLQRGFSRTKTVLLLYAVSIVFLLIAFAMYWSEQRFVPIVFGMIFLVFLFVTQGREIGLDWLMVGRSLGTSQLMRRQTQYVMALSCWLELEGERRGTLDELWEDFTFMVRKTGFTRVKVVLHDGHRTWISDEHASQADAKDHIFEFNPGARMIVTFQCTNGRLDDMACSHLSELTAEAWLKAVMHWCRTMKQPLQFTPSLEVQTRADVHARRSTPEPIA